MVSGQKMCWRLFDELEWNASAVELLQRVEIATPTIFKVLMNDFEFAFELNWLTVP